MQADICFLSLRKCTGRRPRKHRDSGLRVPKTNEVVALSVIFHTNAGTPVLTGDMLLSVPAPNTHTDLRLPSQPNGITIPSDVIPSHVPIRMRRKIFIVNDHLAVGGAGSAMHVALFIDDLTNEFRDRRTFTRAGLTGFLDQYGSSQQGRETLDQIGWLILVKASDWRGSLTKALTHHRNIVTQQYGRVVAIGSGAESIIEQVQKLDNSNEWGMAQPPDGGLRFPEFKTLAQNLVLLGHLYWTEFTSPANVFEAWGGAYDLIYQDSNGIFQYLNDYTIVLRVFDVDESEKGIQLMNVLKYERRAEVSFIVMLNNGQLAFFGAKDITSSDDPVTVTLGKGDLTMNSRVHMSIIAVRRGNKYLLPLIQIDGLDPTEQSRQTVFTDFDEEGRLRVFFNAEHDKWLEEQAISYFRRYAHKWS